MKISEIFLSIEGEGVRTGAPTIFIRFTKCNLRCYYCDTLYALDEPGIEITRRDVLERAKALNKGVWNRVTITGGEPLMEDNLEATKQLVDDFTAWGWDVNIETNGTYPLEWASTYRRQAMMCGGRLFFTIDVKCPDSGFASENPLEYVIVDEEDVLKFVIASETDLDFMHDFLKESDQDYTVYASPVFGEIEPKQIVDYVLENNLDVRVGLQTHKIIWKPEMRGV
jgi:7-carboxy-7-deazaguanine synthase